MNPTLIRRAGVTRYERFARTLVDEFPDIAISLPVLESSSAARRRELQAMTRWGPNVLVKLPIVSPTGESMVNEIGGAARDGIRINVTGILTLAQAEVAFGALSGSPGAPLSFVSFLSGRIADTGRDPSDVVAQALARCPSTCHVVWASVREVANIYAAERCGCHAVTAPPAVLARLRMRDEDLDAVSLATIREMYPDGVTAELAPGR